MANLLISGLLISIFIKSYLLYVGKSTTFGQYAWKNRPATWPPQERGEIRLKTFQNALLENGSSIFSVGIYNVDIFQLLTYHIKNIRYNFLAYFNILKRF